jgi:hypothetical protein
MATGSHMMSLPDNACEMLRREAAGRDVEPEPSPNGSCVPT